MIAALLLGASAGAALSLVQPPTYDATSKVFVSIVGNNVSDLSQGNTFTQQAVGSFAEVATTPYVLDAVISRLELRTTPADLARSITARAPLDTVLIEITATGSSAKEAADISNAVADELTRAVDRLATTTGRSPLRLTVIEKASSPTSPAAPRPALYVALGGALIVVLALVVIVLRALIDTRIRGTQDIAAVADGAIVGRIPSEVRVGAMPLPMLNEPRGPFAEAVRGLRASMHFLTRPQAVKTVVITSSVASEGKSTVCVNLALAFAEAGQRVLLVEGDLRRPVAVAYFGFDNALGLSDLLADDVTFREVVQEWGERGMHVLPAGTVPPNPSELLANSAVRDRLAPHLGEYDIVLIDSPPILPVSDAVELAQQSDGAIVVVGTDRVRKDQLRAALDTLTSVGIRPLGLVSTFVSLSEVRRFGYTYYGD